jgi:hypothetical protein
MWSPSARPDGGADALRAAQLNADLGAVLAQPEGRRYVLSLLDRCGVFRSVYAPGSMEYLEGRRTVGLEILQDIERVGPAWVIQVLTEAMNAETDDRDD